MSTLVDEIKHAGFIHALLDDAVQEIESLQQIVELLENENARFRKLLMIPPKEAHTMEPKPLLFYPPITMK